MPTKAERPAECLRRKQKAPICNLYAKTHLTPPLNWQK